VLVEELQKIVRGQPPLSPAIARRLLTHFRPGGGRATAPNPVSTPGFSCRTRLPDQQAGAASRSRPSTSA
jgi:two-component system, NarL family, nitrate/nitrite response regulator NarL